MAPGHPGRVIHAFNVSSAGPVSGERFGHELVLSGMLTYILLQWLVKLHYYPHTFGHTGAFESTTANVETSCTGCLRHKMAACKLGRHNMIYHVSFILVHFKQRVNICGRQSHMRMKALT